MKRKIYDKLLDWKKRDRGASALLIEGARRVGKSTLVSQFARQEYRSAIVIDFAAARPEIKALFQNGAEDLNLLFNSLSDYYQTPLHERDVGYFYSPLYTLDSLLNLYSTLNTRK